MDNYDYTPCERCSKNPSEPGKLLCKQCEAEVDKRLEQMEDKIHELERKGVNTNE